MDKLNFTSFTKIISWIQFMYKNYELDKAESEIYMFLKRSEAMGLIDGYAVNMLLVYSRGKYKLGQDLNEYDEYLQKMEGEKHE